MYADYGILNKNEKIYICINIYMHTYNFGTFFCIDVYKYAIYNFIPEIYILLKLIK